MGTRRTVSVMQPDKTIKTIYCHWDGYMTGVGAALFSHYNTEGLANELIELGDCSVISDTTSIKPPEGSNHTYDEPIDGVVVAYHRDRGEEYQKPRIFQSVKGLVNSQMAEGYNYLFKEGKWFVNYTNGTDLTELTAKNTT